MGKLQDFLENNADKLHVEGEVTVQGLPFPFVVQSITQEEAKKLRKEATKVTYDKRLGQKNIEVDADVYNAKIISACCLDPDFKNAELQQKYNVKPGDDQALIEKILKPFQYLDLLQKINEMNGFNTDVNAEKEEAKNS